MKNLNSLLIVASLLLCASVALAAEPAIGSKPSLKGKAMDGSNFDLANLRGKIVVVDFWATWCGPCMAVADDMVRINKKWGPKGMVMVGVSMDQDLNKMKQVAKEKGFDWVQLADGKVWKTEWAVAWGVNSIPRTFVFAPDGTLLWQGHPGELEQQVERAFKSHPPVMVDPKVVEAALSTLTQVEALLESNSYAEAFKMLGTIPADAKSDEAFAARMGEVSEKLQKVGEAQLEEVEKLVAEKSCLDAVARLKGMSTLLAGTPVGANAKKRLGELMGMPEVASAVTAAEKAALANDQLAQANKLRDDKKHEAAYGRFKEIVQRFPGTDAAASASEMVSKYESDAAFMKKMTDAQIGQKAKSMISLAESYQRAGQKDKARAKYQEVIDQFPQSSYADLAREALANLK
jgi:thiol-disulfide isomerase/thioredoxin